MLNINGSAHELESVIRVSAGDQVAIELARGGSWYGHGFNHDQPYPLERGSIDNQKFAVNNIQSPIWMCSAGYAFLAETMEALTVTLNKDNDGLLKISSKTDFDLRIFRGETLVEARGYLMSHLNFKRPEAPAELVGDSLFCTWTQFPRAITQQRILNMAREIRKNEYPCSTLIIDDRWDSCFGELDFGADFPEPKVMIDELHAMGFKVMLWVTPFVNNDSAVYEKLAKSGALVRKKAGDGAAEFRWWGGTAGLVDLTADAGKNWYRERLLYLKELGADGFKIDGGDAKYMPGTDVSEWEDFPGPSGYSDILLKTFEDIAPGMCETRTAWLSQNRDIIWRLGGKDSHWGEDNGLKALVHLSLHLSLMGYDMLIPDMVPGRVQTMESDLALPTDELMVRWTEVSALFPLVQFSYYPWNYADSTAEVVHAYAMLHKALEGYIVDSAKDTASPLIKPMWFTEPDKADYYQVSDQFLLGNDLLVCPVLDEGLNQRSVIIPAGTWIDAWTGKAYIPGTYTVDAPCPGMPLFVRSENRTLFHKANVVLAKIRRGVVESGVITAKHQCGLDRDLSVTG